MKFAVSSGNKKAESPERLFSGPAGKGCHTASRKFQTDDDIAARDNECLAQRNGKEILSPQLLHFHKLFKRVAGTWEAFNKYLLTD